MRTRIPMSALAAALVVAVAYAQAPEQELPEGLEWLEQLQRIERDGAVDRLAELERVADLVREGGVAAAAQDALEDAAGEPATVLLRAADIAHPGTAALDLEELQIHRNTVALDREGIRMTPDDEAVALAERTARDSGVGGGIPTSANAARLGVFNRVLGGGAGGGDSGEPQEPPPGTLIIFGSTSIPEPELEQLLAAASRPDTVFALRGNRQGESTADTVGRIQGQFEDPESPPNLMLDPTLFQRYDVEVAPTMVLLRDAGLPPLRATGTVDAVRLHRAVDGLAAGGNPDLGQLAEVYEIAEVDMIAEMQRRMSRFPGVQLEMEGTAGTEQVGFDLPDAPADAAFEVDPTVHLIGDVTDAEGQVIARTGEPYNPLQTLPMNSTVVAFRATSRAHVEIATRVTSQTSAEGGRTVLMATGAGEGQEGVLQQLEQELGTRVYALEPHIASRFNLRHLPAAVIAADDRLVVREWAVESDPDTNDLLESVEEAQDAVEQLEGLIRIFR